MSAATNPRGGLSRRASATERSETSTPMTRGGCPIASATKRPTCPAAPQPTSSTGPSAQPAAKLRSRSRSKGFRASSPEKSAAYCSAMRSNERRTASCGSSAPATSGTDAKRGAELAKERDGRKVGEPAGTRVLGGDVLDLDPETAELALDGDAVMIHRLRGRGVDLDACLLGADAGE